MAADYEIQLVGETEVENNTSYTIQTNFTFADYAEYIITAKLKAYTNSTTNSTIDVGFTESDNSISSVTTILAAMYYMGYNAYSSNSGGWWGGTSNSAFRPLRINSNASGYGTDKWTLCHWQIASQNQSTYWPWVGQTMVPYTDGRLGVYGGTFASNTTYGGSKGGIYVRCNDYPFASGSKLSVWGLAHV
tara:strand:+ start:1147 stop:1716 length:570 start_codon:yes stop_codon:yes gene_type:complete